MKHIHNYAHDDSRLASRRLEVTNLMLWASAEMITRSSLTSRRMLMLDPGIPTDDFPLLL